MVRCTLPSDVPAYPSYRKMEGAPAADGKAARLGTGEENRTYWVPLFEKYRVPVVLEHHDHTFKRTKPLIGGLSHANGVLYLGDGSWGRLRNPQKPDKLRRTLKAERVATTEELRKRAQVATSIRRGVI